MSEDKKKQPWFQIHLSTAVVLALAAGLLMWANILHNYPNSGWPYRHGQFLTIYTHEGNRPLFLNALHGLWVLTLIGIGCEKSIRSQISWRSISTITKLLLIITFTPTTLTLIWLLYLQAIDPSGTSSDNSQIHPLFALLLLFTLAYYAIFVLAKWCESYLRHRERKHQEP